MSIETRERSHLTDLLRAVGLLELIPPTNWRESEKYLEQWDKDVYEVEGFHTEIPDHQDGVFIVKLEMPHTPIHINHHRIKISRAVDNEAPYITMEAELGEDEVERRIGNLYGSLIWNIHQPREIRRERAQAKLAEDFTKFLNPEDHLT